MGHLWGTQSMELSLGHVIYGSLSGVIFRAIYGAICRAIYGATYGAPNL